MVYQQMLLCRLCLRSLIIGYTWYYTSPRHPEQNITRILKRYFLCVSTAPFRTIAKASSLWPLTGDLYSQCWWCSLDCFPKRRWRWLSAQPKLLDWITMMANDLDLVFILLNDQSVTSWLRMATKKVSKRFGQKFWLSRYQEWER